MTTTRTWPGAPRKSTAVDEPWTDDDYPRESPRYTGVERSARAIGYREGERHGTRAGYYWGLISGMTIGAAIAAAAVVGWVVYRYPPS